MSIANKLTTIAENEQKVYDAGIEQGRQAEHDEFWDAYQNGGNRTEYRTAFYGSGWTDTTFKPQYDIKPIGSVQGMFQNSAINNLAEILEAQGVELDFSKCTTISYAFYLSQIAHIGVIDTTSAASILDMVTYSSNLHTIDLLKLKSDGSQTIGGFTNCKALKNITIEGTIGNDANFKDSPLSRASIESIIGCLSTTASGKTLTLKKTAKEAAFTAEEWATLTATKTNWTISLV